MEEINNLKVQIFDIIRQQEVLATQNNQLEQAKIGLVKQLQILENTPQEEENGEDIQTDN